MPQVWPNSNVPRESSGNFPKTCGFCPFQEREFVLPIQFFQNTSKFLTWNTMICTLSNGTSGTQFGNF